MKRNSVLGAFLLVVWVVSPLPPLASAQPAQSSYIDRLKNSLPQEPPSGPEPYSRTLKRQVQDLDAERARKEADSPSSAEDYSRRLRQRLPESESESESMMDSYTRQQKLKIESKETTGAIQAVAEGRSELKMNRGGRPKGAGGIRLGLKPDFSISAESASQEFYSVYDEGWSPDLNLYYEFRILNSDWLGSLGLLMGAGFSFFKGKGVFQYALVNPVTGGSFGAESKTELRFITVPLSIGVSYWFNLLRLVKPYVQVSPTALFYFESRSDEQRGNRGYSWAVRFSGGAAISMDWLSSSSSWDLYDGQGIKHTYLTFEYSRMETLSGPVAFQVSGLYGGLSFEF